MTEKYITIEIDKELLEQINDVYSDTRYPSDIGLIPSGKPSLDIAKRFYNFAVKIKNEINKKTNT